MNTLLNVIVISFVLFLVLLIAGVVLMSVATVVVAFLFAGVSTILSLEYESQERMERIAASNKVGV